MKKICLLIIGIYAFTLPSWALVRSSSAVGQDKNISEQFWQAVRIGDETRVKKLINKDKALVFKQQKGWTAYLWAVDHGNKKMAWLLAEYWSRPNAICEKGNALHVAVENMDFGMLKLTMKVAQLESDEMLTHLINSPRLSAKPGQKKADMNTPLHVAAQLCQRQMYEYLVVFGGNEKARNANFKTPLELLNSCPPENTTKKENKR